MKKKKKTYRRLAEKLPRTYRGTAEDQQRNSSEPADNLQRTSVWDGKVGDRPQYIFCARPTFASNRLARIDDQQLIYKLPPGDVWGRHHIKLTPMELPVNMK